MLFMKDIIYGTFLRKAVLRFGLWLKCALVLLISGLKATLSRVAVAVESGEETGVLGKAHNPDLVAV